MNEDPAQSGRFEARHFDGLTAESRHAVAWVDAAGVWVASAAGTSRLWMFAELVLVRGEGRGEPVQLERRAHPVEVLIVPDRAFLAHLRAALPAGTRLARSGGWAPNPRVVVSLALAAIVLLFTLYRFVIPALADFAADRMPAAWERSYGDAITATLAPEEERVHDPRLLRPAEEIHRQLHAQAGDGEEVRLLVVGSEVPNAFAVPGGTVVVTTGLLRALRSPDELAAVLAHEYGHVRRGHVMRGIMRRLSLGLLLGLIAGDQSALSSGLRAAGELGALSYGRQQEREADDEAIDLLRQCGASPLALADALESIGRAAPSAHTLGFLSTHPAPEERLARIRSASNRMLPGTPAWRSDVGWEGMKIALAGPSPDVGSRAPSAADGPRESTAASSGPAERRREPVAGSDPEDRLPEFGEYVYVEELPEAIEKVPPEYPELARRAGVQGVVLVQALVGRDGRVKDARVVKRVPLLDDAAVAAVRQWVFKPARAHREPVAVWVAIPVRFSLQ